MTRQAVEAPTPRPPRFGIVAAASTIEDGTDWAAGFKFNPEGCGAGGRVIVECAGNTGAMDEPSRRPLVEGDPFAIYAANECETTMGFMQADYEARARRALETTRSYEIGNEIWRGDLTQGVGGLVNLPLTSLEGDVVTSAAADPIDALACLESGLASATKGRQGMVHVTPQLLTHLVGAYVVTLVGNTYMSPNGHIVVPDAGYDGSGPGATPVPAGATQWAYATSMLALRLGPVDVIPGSLAEAKNFAAAVDRAVNKVRVWATQLVAYEWDECALMQAEVDLPVCSIGGVS